MTTNNGAEMANELARLVERQKAQLRALASERDALAAKFQFEPDDGLRICHDTANTPADCIIMPLDRYQAMEAERDTQAAALHDKELAACALETEIIAMRSDLETALSERDALKKECERMRLLIGAAKKWAMHAGPITINEEDQFEADMEACSAALTKKASET